MSFSTQLPSPGCGGSYAERDDGCAEVAPPRREGHERGPHGVQGGHRRKRHAAQQLHTGARLKLASAVQHFGGDHVQHTSKETMFLSHTYQ